MPDRDTEPPGTLPAAAAGAARVLRRHRKPLAGAFVIFLVAVAAALAIPVSLPDAGRADVGGRLGADPVALALVEDLDAFLASRRWGVSLAEVEAKRRAAENAAAGGDPARDRVVFVGTSATPDDRVVLLTLPGGGVARVPAGGALPDGRTLSSATDTTATVSGVGRRDEELELFPKPSLASGETVEPERKE